MGWDVRKDDRVVVKWSVEWRLPSSFTINTVDYLDFLPMQYEGILQLLRTGEPDKPIFVT